MEDDFDDHSAQRTAPKQTNKLTEQRETSFLSPPSFLSPLLSLSPPCVYVGLVFFFFALIAVRENPSLIVVENLNLPNYPNSRIYLQLKKLISLS